MKKNRVVRLDRLQVVWSVGIIIVSIFSAWAVLRLIRVLPKENFEQKITASITRQGAWFVRNQTEAGDFVYERYSATGEVKEGNNIVRQAGALYGLAQLYGYSKDSDIRQTLEKGLDYFRGLTATQSAETLAVTHNEETLTNTTALLVLGITEYLEADNQHKTTENLEHLVRLSNYLVSTQATTGAYINNYTPEPEESDYNNGETMYALMRSYQITQKESYITSVKRMANYAMNTYGLERFNSSFFSWGMAGFAHLYTVEPDEKYWEFLKGYADKYMSARGYAYGQFVSHKAEGTITPGASVFLEGVDHIAWIAKDKDAVLFRSLRSHVRDMLNFLFKYEIGGPYGTYAALTDSVRGAICSQEACETTRIDFLQHNMSAMLLYLRFLQ